MTIPTARLVLLPVGIALLLPLLAGCSGYSTPPVLSRSGASADEGYGWRPDAAVSERASELYSGDDPVKQEAAYNKAYYELYHSTPDNAVADWQIAKRANELYSGDDAKKRKEAYRKAYYETWGRFPPKGQEIPDTRLWIDPTSPQERERQELGLDKPSASSKIGTK